jgi:hypothetical protein
MNIRKESNRQYYHLNWAGPKKAASIRALRGNEEAATHGRHRNDARYAYVHDRTFAHCPQWVLQFSSAKNFEHGEEGRVTCIQNWISPPLKNE